jgi:hypothetical protein
MSGFNITSQGHYYAPYHGVVNHLSGPQPASLPEHDRSRPNTERTDTKIVKRYRLQCETIPRYAPSISMTGLSVT